MPKSLITEVETKMLRTNGRALYVIQYSKQNNEYFSSVYSRCILEEIKTSSKELSKGVEIFPSTKVERVCQFGTSTLHEFFFLSHYTLQSFWLSFSFLFILFVPQLLCHYFIVIQYTWISFRLECLKSYPSR